MNCPHCGQPINEEATPRIAGVWSGQYLSEPCDTCGAPSTYIVQWMAGGKIERKCAEHAPTFQFNAVTGPAPYYQMTRP